jgi:hypothetical protein
MKPVRNIHHELPEYYLDRARWVESMQRDTRPSVAQHDGDLVIGLLVFVLLCCGILAIVSRGAGWWG